MNVITRHFDASNRSSAYFLIVTVARIRNHENLKLRYILLKLNCEWNIWQKQKSWKYILLNSIKCWIARTKNIIWDIIAHLERLERIIKIISSFANKFEAQSWILQRNLEHESMTDIVKDKVRMTTEKYIFWVFVCSWIKANTERLDVSTNVCVREWRYFNKKKTGYHHFLQNNN